MTCGGWFPWTQARRSRLLTHRWAWRWCFVMLLVGVLVCWPFASTATAAEAVGAVAPDRVSLPVDPLGLGLDFASSQTEAGGETQRRVVHANQSALAEFFNNWMPRSGVLIDQTIAAVAEDCANYIPCQLVFKRIRPGGPQQSQDDGNLGEVADAGVQADAEPSVALPGRVLVRIPRRLFVQPESPTLAALELERLLHDPLVKRSSVSDESRLVLRLFLLVNERASGNAGSKATTATDIRQLDVDGVVDWLLESEHNLVGFADVFKAAGVDGPTLAALDLDDLAELGAGLRIHQKRLLRAVAHAQEIFSEAQSTDRVDNQPSSQTHSLGATADGKAAAASPEQQRLEEKEQRASNTRSALVQWYKATLGRPYIGRLLQFSARDVAHLQRHAVEVQEFFGRYFSVVNGQRLRIEEWYRQHKTVLERTVVASQRLVDPLYFSQLYAFVQTRMVASPFVGSSGMLMVPVLDMINHYAPQYQSEELNAVYNCSFLWTSSIPAPGGGSDLDENPAVLQNWGNVASFQFNSSADSVDVVRSLLSAPANDHEFLLHYGQMNNYHLITRYGFAVPFNRFDSVKVQLAAQRSTPYVQGNPWASVALHAHALRANQSIGRMDDGDIPLRLVRDHGQHAVVVEILGTKNQVFEVSYDGVVPQTLLTAVRFLVGTANLDKDVELEAFGPPQSANRSAEVARRLAAGGRVSKVNEARTLQFLTESFKSALDTYPTSLRDDVELLRASRQGVGMRRLSSSIESAISMRMTAKAILELSIARFSQSLREL
eukprot:INCI16292.7.p1 GENE.INCI16292.7~~INCI16292.7.p1  ORF type:complete len:775 (+),score=130.84 INCI16292.7:145-2469(+)